MTSTDAGFFAHLHPVRPGPGELAVWLTPDRPGCYLVHTEIERANSGPQLVSGEFMVSGTEPATITGTASAHPAHGVRMTPVRPVAGQPSTIEVDTGANHVQPWLGMAGHLIVRDADGRFFAHVHAQGGMAGMSGSGMAMPDETVAQHGSLLRFDFTFPAPGRYPAWVQYARDFEIHTVALTIDVTQ